MGGKGRRRREKNYLAAHGGNQRLPPPPNEKELEALPSKLRKIMELKNSSAKDEVTGSSTETEQGKRKDESSNKKKPNLKESRLAKVNVKLGDDINEGTKNKLVKYNSASAESSSTDVRKKKRKRNSVKDLRFEDLDLLAKHSKRNERKKEYLKDRKNKHQKSKAHDALDFPGREDIRFGEVVMAPPKLSLPKVSKSSMDASNERLRLQAVELYRKRREWDSRLGIKLPSFVETATL